MALLLVLGMLLLTELSEHALGRLLSVRVGVLLSELGKALASTKLPGGAGSRDSFSRSCPFFAGAVLSCCCC